LYRLYRPIRYFTDSSHRDAFAERRYGIFGPRSCWSLGLDARELHHLAPFLGFVSVAEIGGRAGNPGSPQFGGPRLDFGIAEARWLKLLMVEDIGPETLRERDPKKLIPPLHGALIKNEQDVHLFERLAFMARREQR
jgi:hypothetical protein